MKKLLFALVATAAIASFADTTAEETAARHLSYSKRLAHHGGELIKPDSQKGTIVFVNAQKIVPREELSKMTVELAKRSRLNIRLVDGEGGITPMNAEERKSSVGGEIVVFVTDCDKCNTMLLNAPENGWAIVNANAVTKDARNDVFKAARLRKELARAFYSVAGAMNSQYPNSLMSFVKDAKGLDRLTEDVPMDVYGRCLDNLRSAGVTPVQVTTYRRACEQGWAPAPTNDTQKVIWEAYHSKPTEPMRIKFDPKKGE